MPSTVNGCHPPPPLHPPHQVEYVKVWQTKMDYFFSPAAATALAATEAELPLIEDDRDDISYSADNNRNDLSVALPIVFFALLGMLLGGSAVVLVLTIRTRLERVRMYHEICRSDDGSTPAVQSAM